MKNSKNGDCSRLWIFLYRKISGISFFCRIGMMFFKYSLDSRVPRVKPEDGNDGVFGDDGLWLLYGDESR